MHLRRGVRLGRPFGIPLVVHGSWFPAAALLVVHFSLTAYAHRPLPLAISLGLVTTVAFFASLVVHELAHALVARAAGIGVSDITLFVFGGVARIKREPARPRQEFAIALAGPLASGTLGIALLGFGGPRPNDWLHVLGFTNIALAAFNLLPGFPLDGGRILRALLWRRNGDPNKSARIAARSGQLIGVALSIGGVATLVSTRALSGVWLVVLGAFLVALATASRRAATFASRLGAHAAGRWATPFAGVLAPDQVVNGQTPDGPYAVSEYGRLTGVLMPSATVGASGRLVRDAMVPWASHLRVEASQPLMRALESLAAEKSGLLVVMDDAGGVVGVLHHDGVRQRLREGVG